MFLIAHRPYSFKHFISVYCYIVDGTGNLCLSSFCRLNIETKMSIPSSDPHFVVYCLDNLLPLLSTKPYPQRILDTVSTENETFNYKCTSFLTNNIAVAATV